MLEVVHIYFVRLETGEKIAEYLSAKQPPETGTTIDRGTTGIDGKFEILAVNEKPFVVGYNICELRVKELA